MFSPKLRTKKQRYYEDQDAFGGQVGNHSEPWSFLSALDAGIITEIGPADR